MKKWIALAAGLVALVVASPAAAQEGRERVGRQLTGVVSASALQGFKLDGHALTGYSVAGLLQPEGSVTLLLDLMAGRTYRIAGACDRVCGNLDLTLHDSTEPAVALAADTLADKVPLLEFTARTTGPHLLAVRMAACEEASCHFGINVLSK